MNDFWMCLMDFYLFFPHQNYFIIWVLFIVLCKIDSFSRNKCSLSTLLNQNQNLKFHQVIFLFKFFNIHMNEQAITCHDCHGFKWQNINISLILTSFVYYSMPFFTHPKDKFKSHFLTLGNETPPPICWFSSCGQKSQSDFKIDKLKMKW